MPHENTRVIISAIAGGAVGYVLHVLKAKRDDRSANKGRIRDFKQFMGSFRSWANRYTDQLGDFRHKVDAFSGAAASIVDAVPKHKRKRFSDAAGALCAIESYEMLGYDIEDGQPKYHGRTRLLNAIDAVLKAFE